MNMETAHYKEGDKVLVSWKENEGGGWYSNKRQKVGHVRKAPEGHLYIQTALNPNLSFQDLTSIKKFYDPTNK